MGYPKKRLDYIYIYIYMREKLDSNSFRLKLIDLHAMIHRRVPQGFPGSCGALRREKTQGPQGGPERHHVETNVVSEKGGTPKSSIDGLSIISYLLGFPMVFPPPRTSADRPLRFSSMKIK